MTPNQFQNDPYKNYFKKVAIVESGDNPNAKNPFGAAGRYQFLASTWNDLSNKNKLGYSENDRFDPVKSEKVMKILTQQNANYLRKSIKRELNDDDLYLAHFLGAGGASSFIKAEAKNPNELTTSYFSPKIVQQNRNVMLNKDGSPKTLQDIRNWSRSKMSIEIPKTQASNSEVKLSEDKKLDTLINSQIKVTNFVDTQDMSTFEQQPEPVKKAENKLSIEERKKNLFENYIQPSPIVQPIYSQNTPQTEDNYINISQVYAGIENFVDGQSMQQGGVVRDNIPNLIPRRLPDISEKQFLIDYINSPLYRQKLISSGYENVDQEIAKRLNNVVQTNEIRQFGVPGTVRQIYNTIQDIPYSTQGSAYDERTHTLITDTPTDIKNTGYAKPPEIKAHEYGHSEISLRGQNKPSMNPFFINSRLNEYDQSELYSRLRGRGSEEELTPEQFRDLQPVENKADLNALRYLLKKENIYDAGKDKFKKEHLDKLPKSFVKERLLKNYSEQDLIWLMNNIAMNDSNNVDYQYAQRGGEIPTSNLGLWEYPQQPVRVPSPNITMKGIDYPVLGISEQTGERKLMQPNLQYFFNRTSSILEIPLKNV